MPLIRSFPSAQSARRRGLLAQLRGLLVAALARRRERAMLVHLDTHLLRDIGIDPEVAAAEAEKPCWRA